MSKKYNESFLNDPVGFTKKHTLAIGIAPSDTKLKDRITHSSVTASDRVIYWDITEEKENKDGQKVCEVNMSRKKKKDYYLPGYYLPWGADSIYKITLIDKRNVKPDTPLAFFTAALTGCSVFVEGTRKVPTIYHANAIGAKVTGNDLVQRDKRAVIMEKRWAFTKPAKRAVKKKALFRPAFEGRALHPYHYMYHKEDVISWRENLYGQGKIRKVDVYDHRDLGTVFGVISKGEWSFFVQAVILVKHTAGISKLATWYSKSAEQFWPGGSGKVVYHQDVPKTTPLKEMGFSGKTLRLHLFNALEAYRKKIKFNQSQESKNAYPILRTVYQNRGHSDILVAIRYYLGLDNAKVGGIVMSSKLKQGGTFYSYLNKEYELWKGP